jgi:cell division protein FtsI/penicillin-binding protein 2
VSSKRIGILLGGISVAYCALLARLAQLQFSPDAAPAPGLDPVRTLALPPARGAISDKDGRLLRATRDAFDVHVTAPTFREKNVVDAMADLAVLVGGGPETAGSLARSRLVAELRGAGRRPAIDRVLALDPTTALLTGAEDLRGRALVLTEPEGTLVRPATYARRRVLDALVVIAGPRGPTLREIRKRLHGGPTSAGAIAGTTVDVLEERVLREDGLLCRLGGEIALGDAADVRIAIEERCDRHFRRVEAEVERRVDDAICLQHFGSWSLDPYQLGERGVARVRARTNAPADWSLADVRAAFCRQVRAEPSFERSRYLDERKESQTRNELAAFRSDELGFGGTFALASVVDGPGGLRALGFELVPSFTRDAAKRQPGSNLAMLLGEVSRRNTPTGGLEERLDPVLRGEPGQAVVRGPRDGAAIVPPRHGRDVALTLSLPLQQRVEGLLDRTGAVAVVDVATGGILCAATWPAPPEAEVASAVLELQDLRRKAMDLRARARAGDAGAAALLAPVWDRIVSSPAFHRAVTSETNMPPGSVMKALTLLAGLEAGVIHPAFSIECTTGQLARFGCHRCGRVELEDAIEKSCNEYCYRTVDLLGGSGPLIAMFDRVGLFDPIPGAIGRAAGEWMRDAIRVDDPKNLAIGQGSLSLPPVRLAAVAASLAHGRAVRAHLWADDGYDAIGAPIGRADHLEVIRSGMRKVAVGERGTARRFRRQLEPLGIAGKTGTAQVRSGDEELYQAWFVGFAPHHAPRYAFAVLIERTSDEGADAAPIAARVVDACYEVLGGRP